MLGQPDKVRSSPSNVSMFHHHGWELDGEPGGGGSRQMPTGTQSITFIHTDKKQDDVPWQLIMLQVCMISLQPLMMCLACKYFKLSISCVFTCQVLFLI